MVMLNIAESAAKTVLDNNVVMTTAKRGGKREVLTALSFDEEYPWHRRSSTGLSGWFPNFKGSKS
jgi:hypothetical protein